MHFKDFEGRKTFMMMVGLPGCGKDFWIRNFLNTIVYRDADNWLAIGTDDIFEEWAERDGISYNEAFDRYDFKDVEREFKIRIKQAFIEEKNVIWNQTNMTSNARMKKLRLVPSDYYKMALIVTVSGIVLNEQLAKRELETNGAKTIPDFVLKNMANGYVRPSKAEGFDQIVDIKP